MFKIEVRVPSIDVQKNINVEDILDESAAFLISRILNRFLAEKDPNNIPWIPSRAAIERRKQGGTGTLFDTGKLFRSIQVHKTKHGQRKISTDVDYGIKHQHGLDGMPVRKFLGFNKDDETMIHQIVRMRVNEALKK